MLSSFGNPYGRKAPQPHKGAAMIPEPQSPFAPRTAERKQSYSKIFRYRLPDGQTSEPASVEILGTFTHWKPVPLLRDSVLGAWSATIHHIEGNKTHHYMLLVDGHPAY